MMCNSQIWIGLFATLIGFSTAQQFPEISVSDNKLPNKTEQLLDKLRSQLMQNNYDYLPSSEEWADAVAKRKTQKEKAKVAYNGNGDDKPVATENIKTFKDISENDRQRRPPEKIKAFEDNDKNILLNHKYEYINRVRSGITSTMNPKDLVSKLKTRNKHSKDKEKYLRRDEDTRIITDSLETFIDKIKIPNKHFMDRSKLIEKTTKSKEMLMDKFINPRKQNNEYLNHYEAMATTSDAIKTYMEKIEATRNINKNNNMNQAPSFNVSRKDLLYYMDNIHLQQKDDVINDNINNGDKNYTLNDMNELYKEFKGGIGNDTNLYTNLDRATTSKPKYKVIKLKNRHPNRRGMSQRRFVQEEGPDGVAIIRLDDGPFPQFHLPRDRRQYMRGPDSIELAD